MPESIQAEIAAAVQTVYKLDVATPMEKMKLDGGSTIHLKREDASKIHSYKWRGAFNKMTSLKESGYDGPCVTTSAGNHAQGVAAAARQLDMQATIFMPTSTPKLKQKSVSRHGGSNVRIKLVGDTFDESQLSARKFAEEVSATILSPFDDPLVIAGQATVGVEILDQNPDVQFIYVPVGGGGLASGVAAYVKHNAPHVKVIGVEVEGQDSMRQSIEAGKRVTLPDVSRFCDGTAVACPGEHTFQLCRDHLDEIIVVSNDQVCRSIQVAWEEKRMITEPSGAIALAGALSRNHNSDDNVVVVISGSNTDFLTIPIIARRSRLTQPTRCYYQFEISENNGSLIGLLDQLMEGINIVDFQYGRTARDCAMPVLGFNGTQNELDQFSARIKSTGIPSIEVTGDETVAYRVIPFQPELTKDPCFLRIDFPDRPGALRDMMRQCSSFTSICYFNFQESGESDGRALIGFEFATNECRKQFFATLDKFQFKYFEVDATRLLGGSNRF